MFASKVTIDPRLTQYSKLSLVKRKKLRKQAIIDLIKSKPYGTFINIEEFKQITQLNANSAVYNILREMRKEGKLTVDDSNPHHYIYYVHGDVHTVKQPDQMIDVERETPNEPETIIEPQFDTFPPIAEVKTWNFKQLENEAMRFDFYKPGSFLRDFLDWLKQQ